MGFHLAQIFVPGGGEGDGRDMVPLRLESSAQGAGIGNVLSGVEAVVDAGEDHIRLFLQQVLQRHLDAVHGGASDAPGAPDGRRKVQNILHGDQLPEGQLLGQGAALLRRRCHPDFAQLRRRPGQDLNAGGVDGIVVYDQKLHILSPDLKNTPASGRGDVWMA